MRSNNIITNRLAKNKLREEEIVRLYYEEKLGCYAIGELLDRDGSSIAQFLKYRGYKLRSYGEAQKLAYKMGRKEQKKGKDNPNWKGGRIIAEGGYIAVLLQPDDPYASMAKGGRPLYVLEHRMIMAQHIGRILKKGEIVHHLNGIRTDNRFKNLALVSPRTHDNHTYIKALQERIRELEAEISQGKLF